MGCDVLYIFRGGGHGGDAMMTLRLAAAVQARGYSVRVMVSSGELHADVFQETAEELGVPCDVVDYFAEHGRWSRWTMFSNLAKYLLKCSPKVLHLHTGNAFVNPSLALALALLVRGRRIVTLHGAEPARPDEERSWRYLQHLFHRFIYPSNHERLRQAGFIPRIALFGETIGNLISLAHDEIDRQQVRLELGITDEVMILYCARLDPIKRPAWAIKAFRDGALENSNAVLVVAGDGEQREECRQSIADLGPRAKSLGYRKDVSRLLEAADIYMLPTRAENLSLGILEAMSAGLAIISTDIPGVTEALGEAGMVCPSDSQESFSIALQQAVMDKSLRRDLAHRARTRFISQFAPSIIVAAHLKVYGLEVRSQSDAQAFLRGEPTAQPA